MESWRLTHLRPLKIDNNNRTTATTIIITNQLNAYLHIVFVIMQSKIQKHTRHIHCIRLCLFLCLCLIRWGIDNDNNNNNIDN